MVSFLTTALTLKTMSGSTVPFVRQPLDEIMPRNNSSHLVLLKDYDHEVSCLRKTWEKTKLNTV